MGSLLLKGKISFIGNVEIDSGYITCTHITSGIESNTYRLNANPGNHYHSYEIDLSNDSWLQNTPIIDGEDGVIAFNIELVSKDNNMFIKTDYTPITQEVLTSMVLEHNIELTENDRLTHGYGDY